MLYIFYRNLLSITIINKHYMDNLIQTALAYYDKNMLKYKEIFKKVDSSKVLNFENKHDLEPNVIELYDNNGNKLMTANYEKVGSYINNLWIWSWASTEITTKNIKLAKKILNYGVDLIAIYDDKSREYKYNSINIFLKTELVTSRIFISNRLQLDIHLAIASYICKNPIIFSVYLKTNGLNYYDYYFLSNIKKA